MDFCRPTRTALWALLLTLPAFAPAQPPGLEPLDNAAMSASRVSSNVDPADDGTDPGRVEEQQRLLPDAEVPAPRPDLLLPGSPQGLSPVQQQLIDNLRGTIGDFNSPPP